MSVELKVPPVGESITEVTVGDWLMAEGAWVAVDQPVVIVESEKVNLEVPAPVSGVVSKVLHASGATVHVGDVLALIEPQAQANAPAAEAPKPAAAAEAPKPAAEAPKPAAEAAKPAAEAPKPAAEAPKPAAEQRVMPSAQRVLAQGGVEATDVAGTGPGGRVLKEDAQKAVEAKKAPAPPPPAPPKPAPGGAADRQEEIVAMSPLRRTVAARLVEAQQAAALLTTFNEIDMTEVMALRTTHQKAYEERYALKLGFMSFFVKAVVDGFWAFPALNAEVRGTDIVYRNYYDIGIAIGGGKGLVVPILRNAERLSFAEIEKAIGDYGARARDNKLKIEELRGGTFSITNGGVYGSLLSTPIVNPPQSGILGMHAIQDRPVALAGQVVIRPMMYVALTYDHRIVDGREAVSFLKRVKLCVEQPVRMLLEV